MSRASIIAIAIAALVALSGCERGRTYSSSDAFTLRTNLAELTENSVRVVLAMESDARGLPVIRATFTPTEKGLHLYGKDMPEEGGGYNPPRLRTANNGMERMQASRFCQSQFQRRGRLAPTAHASSSASEQDIGDSSYEKQETTVEHTGAAYSRRAAFGGGRSPDPA